jgi:hypothetical protein
MNIFRAREELLCIDDAGSTGVFSAGLMTRLLSIAQQHQPMVGQLVASHPPGARRDQAIRTRDAAGLAFAAGRDGVLRLWTDPVPDRYGKLRPEQDRIYVVGADVSNGLGASNSVATVVCVDEGRVVAELVSSRMEPHEFARAMLELAIWFGGRRGCIVGWEANGPGQSVAKHVTDLRYPYVYVDEQGRQGWTSTPRRKVELAERLGAAWNTGQLVDWSEHAIQEAMDWVWMGPERIGPAKLRKDAEAQATHGDRVVSRMGAVMLMQAAPVPRAPTTYSSLTAKRVAEVRARDAARENQW